MINLATVLTLTRPLVVFDLETTGLNPEQDRIKQIGITKHYPDKDPIPWVQRINPGVPIPQESSDVTGITDADVANAPPFSFYAAKLAGHLIDVDFAGYNVLFDLRCIRAEFRRCNVIWDWEKTDAKVIDPLQIYREKFPRDLKAAYKEFVDQRGFEGAHDAGNDVSATEAVLVGQLQRYPDIPRTVAELADYCFPQKKNAVDRTGHIVWRGGVACIGFGKHNGKPLREMNTGYLKWMLKENFPPDTKRIIEAALEGIFPTVQS